MPQDFRFNYPDEDPAVRARAKDRARELIESWGKIPTRELLGYPLSVVITDTINEGPRAVAAVLCELARTAAMLGITLATSMDVDDPLPAVYGVLDANDENPGGA